MLLLEQVCLSRLDLSLGNSQMLVACHRESHMQVFTGDQQSQSPGELRFLSKSRFCQNHPLQPSVMFNGYKGPFKGLHLLADDFTLISFHSCHDLGRVVIPGSTGGTWRGEAGAGHGERAHGAPDGWLPVPGSFRLPIFAASVVGDTSNGWTLIPNRKEAAPSDLHLCSLSLLDVGLPLVSGFPLGSPCPHGWLCPPPLLPSVTHLLRARCSVPSPRVPLTPS